MTQPLFLIVALLFAPTQAIAADEHRAELFVGGGVAFTGPNFYVTVYSDGLVKVKRTGMPIVPPGKLTEIAQTFRVSANEAEALLKLADEADDLAKGCRTVADGTSARLSVIKGGKTNTRTCSNAADWPVGRKTRRFLERLNRNLPSDWQVH